MRKALSIGALTLFVGGCGSPAIDSESLAISSVPDAVVDWNAIAEKSVVNIAKHPPPVAALDFAILHAAIYDAVEAIDGKYQPYYVSIPGASGSLDAATSKAAHDILVFLFPAQQTALDATYNQYLNSHGISVSDPGISVGAQAAAGISTLRANDGRFPPNYPSYYGNTEIGQWRPTPSYNVGQAPPGLQPMLTPWVAEVKLFALDSTDQFMPSGPTPLDSPEWEDNYNETRDYGSLTSTLRSAEQTEIGYFWADNGPVLWQRAQRDLATRYLHGPSESARMFALADLALADAQIACWHAKKLFNFWRPVTAIQLGGGNSNLTADPNWKPLINTPNFPEYTSGHTTTSGAAVRALKMFFHSDNMTFTMTSTFPLAQQKQRTYDSFSDALNDVINARVWVGIHWRHSDVNGADWGKQVADWTYSHYLHAIDDSDPGSQAVADQSRPANGNDDTDSTRDNSDDGSND